MENTYTQLLLPLTAHDYDPKKFVIGEANAKAIACIHASEQWPKGICVIYGPKGCGKTHLGHVWERSYTHSPILWLRGNAILENNTACKAAIVDLANNFPDGKDDAWMHALTRWQERGMLILILARDPPALWPIVLQDVASRLRSLFTVAIEEPDDTLLQVMLPKWFESRYIHVEATVINFLITTSERSWSHLQELVELLATYALSERVPLSLPRVRNFLQQQEYKRMV